jgi:hypothetical protein
LPWDRMKLLGSHMTTEQTSKRQEQEFMRPWKGAFYWSRKKTGRSVRVCWAENRCVRKRGGQVSESQACGRGWGSRGSERKPGHQGGGWWVPREGIFCAMIRAVFADLHYVFFFFFYSFPPPPMALPAHSGPRPLIQFYNHFTQTVGLLGRVISPSQGHYVNTGQHNTE